MLIQKDNIADTHREQKQSFLLPRLKLGENEMAFQARNHDIERAENFKLDTLRSLRQLTDEDNHHANFSFEGIEPGIQHHIIESFEVLPAENSQKKISRA